MKLRQVIERLGDTTVSIQVAQAFIGDLGFPNWTVYNSKSEFVGLVIQEGDQFTFLPVGYELWIDDDTNTIAAFRNAGQSFSFSTPSLPELRNGVGV